MGMTNQEKIDVYGYARDAVKNGMTVSVFVNRWKRGYSETMLRRYYKLAVKRIENTVARML